jgi:hypothetical protein
MPALIAASLRTAKPLGLVGGDKHSDQILTTNSVASHLATNSVASPSDKLGGQ